jgi:hypothetical protein
MVLDSAFADLVMLAEEMVEKGRQQGLFAPALLVVRSILLGVLIIVCLMPMA